MANLNPTARKPVTTEGRIAFRPSFDVRKILDDAKRSGIGYTQYIEDAIRLKHAVDIAKNLAP